MTEEKPTITYEDFEKLDLRVAEIIEAEEIQGKDKLLKLKINLGDEERTIVAGIKKFYPIEEIIGKKIIVLANLEPKKLAGIESKGMLLAASNDDHSDISLLTTDKEISPGSAIA